MYEYYADCMKAHFSMGYDPVGISLLFKLLLAHVYFWIFWMKCSEILENELIQNIVRTLILQFVVFESKR